MSTTAWEPMFPKTFRGRTRVDDKAARLAQEAQDERDCYARVDARDGLRSRLSGVQLTRGASLTKKAHRHHMVKRSQGGRHPRAGDSPAERRCRCAR